MVSLLDPGTIIVSHKYIFASQGEQLAKNRTSFLSPAATLSSINKRSLKVSNSSKWVFLWFIPLGMKSELKEPKGKFSLSLATRVHASFAANRNAYFDWAAAASSSRVTSS